MGYNVLNRVGTQGCVVEIGSVPNCRVPRQGPFPPEPGCFSGREARMLEQRIFMGLGL